MATASHSVSYAIVLQVLEILTASCFQAQQFDWRKSSIRNGLVDML
jgi:hypothetical protein